MYPIIRLKLHKSQTGGKGTVKTCTMMRKGMELKKNIGRKSLHHFVQRLLVRSVRQQVAKPQELMSDDVPAEMLESGKTALDTGQNAQNMCDDLGNW